MELIQLMPIKKPLAPLAILLLAVTLLMPSSVIFAQEPVTGIDPHLLSTVNATSKDISLIEEYKYTSIYVNKKTGENYYVIDQLPKTTIDDKRIEPSWLYVNDKYYAKQNLFWCEVAGIKVTLATNYDQPFGINAGDIVIFQPQLFLNGVEVKLKSEYPAWLESDPQNENYHQNVLMWDYGIAKRYIRIIEGRLLGSWVFGRKPAGEIRIKYNQVGDFKLHLGQFKINDDEEIVKPQDFDDLISQRGYPVVIGDSSTFYPDADPEVSSVDGWVYHTEAGSWATVHDGAGVTALDDSTWMTTAYLRTTTSPNWYRIGRGIIVWDTSRLPDTGAIDSATILMYGYTIDETAFLGIATNVYSATPSDNTMLLPGDFDSCGTTEFSTEITIDDWKTADPFWNTFTLNSNGIDAISKTGVSKFSFRESNYDAPNIPPAYPGTSKQDCLYCYTAEKGNGYQPKLIVTYTTSSPPPPPSYSTGLKLTRTGDTKIEASWLPSASENATYLLMVSTYDFPDDPLGNFAVAYSGNQTVATLTGYDMELTAYKFSLWTHTNPYSEEYITAEIGGEEVAEQLGSMNEILTSIVMLLPLAFISAMAFWRNNSVLFILAGAVGFFCGLYWYDQYVTNTGLAIALSLITYSFVCWGFAFRYIFWREPE